MHIVRLTTVVVTSIALAVAAAGSARAEDSVPVSGTDATSAQEPAPTDQAVSAPTLSLALPERVVSQQPFVVVVSGVDVELAPGAAAYVDYAPFGTALRRDFQSVNDDGTASFTIRLWKTGLVEVVYGDLHASAEVLVQPAKNPLRDPVDAPEQREAYRNNTDPPALGNGANPKVARLSKRRINSMTGLSWRAGCIPLSSLREIHVNYWGADGYRHRGALIARYDVARRVANALAALYAQGARIQSMHPVDRYGRNPRGPGANDYASMAAGNTSMFNCRYVVGKESLRTVSPHSSGTALDLNPWHNPYVARTGVFPNSWWLGHGGSTLKHSYSSSVVRTLARYGCSWGAGYRDYHHFDCRG